MTEEVWTIPGSEDNPIYVVEGDVIEYGVVYEGTPSSVTSVTVYRDGEDITSTAMASGSNSVSGKTVSWKPLTFGTDDGGTRYVVLTKAVVDGNTENRKTFFHVTLKSGEPGV